MFVNFFTHYLHIPIKRLKNKRIKNETGRVSPEYSLGVVFDYVVQCVISRLQNEDGQIHIEVKMEDDTLWLTQAQSVELYQTSKSNVSEHIKHIFEEGELNEISVVRNFRTTASDGKNYDC